MPRNRLSDLTDFDPMGSYTGGISVAEPNPVAESSPLSNNVDKILNSIFRTDEKRLQLWPERLVRSGATAAGDVASGKVPTLAIDPVTGDVHTSPEMIEKAQEMSALAGTGGLGGTGGNAGMSLGVVPVDIAKKLKFKTGKPNDLLKQAVDNTPAATIDADGHLIVKLSRNQHPDQEMAESVRGGVFYLPEGSKNARYYNGTTGNNYGGRQAIEGETAFVNPLVVKGATGGKAPEMAYNQLMGKDAFKTLEKDIREVTTADIYKKQSPWMKQELTQRFLEKYAPELMNHADYIIENSSKGNQLRYALQEAAIASAARTAGHDGIIGYSVGRGEAKGKPFLSEIFDVRENRYPSPSGDYSVHPELLSDSSKPGIAIQANKGPFLRPALKHKDRLYKGKEGQEHQDIIPDALYNDFQQKAMAGKDLAEYNFGFVNDKGHFLTREKALQYGIDNGIIDPHAGKFGALTSTLLSDNSKPGAAIEAMKGIDPIHFSSVDAAKFRLGQLQRDKAASKKAGEDVNSSGYMFYNTQIRALKDFIKNPKAKSDTANPLPPGYELKPIEFNPFELKT